MEKFSTLTTYAVALEADNIDTDQIMPKQFLRGIDKAGLDKGLFYNLKHKPDGSLDSGCVLNSPTGQKAALLLAGPNFGCGSSREHAPLAIKSCGVKCGIAPSFARIFYRNSINIGLPVIVCKDLYDHIEDGDQMELSLTDGIASVNGQEFVCTKLPPYMQNILDQGGLIASLNKEED